MSEIKDNASKTESSSKPKGLSMVGKVLKVVGWIGVALQLLAFITMLSSSTFNSSALFAILFASVISIAFIVIGKKIERSPGTITSAVVSGISQLSQDAPVRARRAWLMSEHVVLEERTQKYTSTSVSGGGGTINTFNGTVQGQINPVRSTTHFHREQEIWVRNLFDQTEEKLQFSHIEIEVRPGHNLVILTDPETNKMERIQNRSTDWIYSPGNWNAKKLPSETALWTSSIFMSALIWIPILGYVFLIAVLVDMFEYVWKSSPIRVKLTVFGLGLINATAMLWMIGTDSYTARYSSGMYVTASLITVGLFAWYYRKEKSKAVKNMRSVCAEIDDCLANYVKKIA